MLSRNLVRQAIRAQRPLGIRFSSHVMPEGFGVTKVNNIESKVQEIQNKVKAENLTGDAYEARLRELLSHENLTLYKTDYSKGKEFMENYQHTKEHGNETASLWKKISLYVFVPAIVLACVNTYYVEMEHAEHRKHMVESGEKPTQYPYQKWLVKDFFWGDGTKTLFWNDKVNHNKD